MSILPRAALALGAAGAIPFIALAPGPHSAVVDEALGLFVKVTPKEKARIQVAYGATITSFLGGIHWGLASSAVSVGAATGAAIGARYAWSVVPSLVAWPALLCEEKKGAAILAGVVTSALAVDLVFAKKGMFPKWMIPLRIALSTCAVVSLISTANSQSLTEDRDFKP